MQVECDGPALCFAFIAGFFLACVIAAFCIKPVLDAGARAHADGKVVVRKVLGTLPVTADGCVVGDVPDHGALVFLNGYADVATPYRMTLCIRCIAEPEDDADSWSVVDNGELAPSASRWYSTREAAEAAVKAKQKPKP